MRPDPAPLLAWYDRHARRLPWRVGPAERAVGVRPDPYHVWLSEVMLQQTTVATVKPYFEDFMRRWPTVSDLAAAPREEVMSAWAGLGYYSRARNLKAAAEAVAARGGRFPEPAAALRELPGVGAYTAAAIAAIAFDEPVAVVDGNVERVLARVFAIDLPLKHAKPIVRQHQERLTPKERAGDYAQAVMDLGATICTPKGPACGVCPWSEDCAARAQGDPELYPRPSAKPVRPTRLGTAHVLRRGDGAILLRRRPESGLLGGMTEVPGSPWSEDADAATTAPPSFAGLVWERMPAKIVHVFTHFRLELTVFRGDAPMTMAAPEGHWWSAAEAIRGEALPTVMKKAIEAAVPGATKGSGPRRRAA
jgi:A/G-specific adenine glycosylase